MLKQLNGLHQKDTESKSDRALVVTSPLPIPSLRTLEPMDEAPTEASVAAVGTNTNLDPMDEAPEEVAESNAFWLYH